MRLVIAKTNVILITHLLCFAGKTVDFFIHSKQAYLLAFGFIPRLFFYCSISHRIKFWNYPSNTKWFLYQLIHNNMTNIRVATRLYLITFFDALFSKSVLSYLDTWRTFFNHPTVQEHHFLTIRNKNDKPL